MLNCGKEKLHTLNAWLCQSPFNAKGDVQRHKMKQTSIPIFCKYISGKQDAEFVSVYQTTNETERRNEKRAVIHVSIILHVVLSFNITIIVYIEF